MPCRVIEIEGVVVDVSVAVEGLGVGRVGDEGIGGEEPGQGGRVVAGIVIVQANLHILPLAGVGVAGEGVGVCCTAPLTCRMALTLPRWSVWSLR